MLTVTTTSPDDQYATTEGVKNLLGISATSDDTMISNMISRASRRADSYVGYPIGLAGYRETLSGYGGRRMMLSRRPVRGVESFWNATDTGTATTMLSSEFKVDLDAGFIERDEGFEWDAPAVPRTFAFPLASHPFAGEEEAPWLADYIAGYSYDGIGATEDLYTTRGGTTSTGRTLPEDIEAAVIHWAAAAYENEHGVTERKVGDLQVKYATDSAGSVVDHAEELLGPYRSVV